MRRGAAWVHRQDEEADIERAENARRVRGRDSAERETFACEAATEKVEAEVVEIDSRRETTSKQIVTKRNEADDLLSSSGQDDELAESSKHKQGEASARCV